MAKVFYFKHTSTLALRQRKAFLLRSFVPPQDLLRASFVTRYTTCGKSNCSCAAGQKHGPFFYLVSNLAKGKILKSLLKSDAERRVVQDGVDAYNSHWALLEELSQINLELLRRGEPLKNPDST